MMRASCPGSDACAAPWWVGCLQKRHGRQLVAAGRPYCAPFPATSPPRDLRAFLRLCATALRCLGLLAGVGGGARRLDFRSLGCRLRLIGVNLPSAALVVLVTCIGGLDVSSTCVRLEWFPALVPACVFLPHHRVSSQHQGSPVTSSTNVTNQQHRKHRCTTHSRHKPVGNNEKHPTNTRAAYGKQQQALCWFVAPLLLQAR